MRTHAGFNGATVRPVYLVVIDLPSGMFRANSSDKNLTVGGDLYYGVGHLGKISEATESVGTAAQTLKLTLTSIPQSMVDGVVAENTRNKDLTVYLCLFQPDHSMVAAPFIIFKGKTDSLNMEVGQMVNIQVSATSRLRQWARSPNSRYTNEDQQSKYPGDKGFQFINALPSLRLQWGT